MRRRALLASGVTAVTAVTAGYDILPGVERRGFLSRGSGGS